MNLHEKRYSKMVEDMQKGSGSDKSGKGIIRDLKNQDPERIDWSLNLRTSPSAVCFKNYSGLNIKKVISIKGEKLRVNLILIYHNENKQILGTKKELQQKTQT